jgi:hypothetical protein
MNFKMKTVVEFYLCVILFFGLFSSNIKGQSNEERKELNNQAAQYYLGSEDELLIKLNVWGFVARPGQYLVPSDTDLISLLSFVGGPMENANLTKIKIVRSGKDIGQVLKINVKEYLTTGDKKNVPALMPGDTIVVPGTKMYYVNKFFEYASRVAIVVQLAWYVTLMSDK